MHVLQNITFMRENLYLSDPKPNEFEVVFNEKHFLVRAEGGHWGRAGW